MARRPFASLLAVAGLGLLLAVALLIAAFPRPLQGAMLSCTEAGGFCFQLLLAGRAASSPLIVLALLLLLGWSGRRGWRAGRRQWCATRAALDHLCGAGVAQPETSVQDLSARLGVRGRVAVVVHRAPVALCAGLWRPRILLSTGLLALLGPAELAAVLAHERAHLRRRDPLRLLVARTLAAALPILPVLRELAAALPLAQELAADRAVIRDQGREALGRAILALAEHGRPPVAPPLAAGMGGALEARLDQLAGDTPPAPPLSRGALGRTALALGAGLLLVLRLVAAPPAPIAWSAPAGWDLLGAGRCLIVLGLLASLWSYLLGERAARLLLRRVE